MKTAGVLIVVLLFAVAAFAWPLMGAWSGELNGKPITIAFQHGNGHAEGTFALRPASASGSPQELRITNLKVREGGRALTFQVPNQAGGMKLVSSGPEQLSFEMELAGTDQATLHSLDDPNAPVIKMTRTAEPGKR